MTTHSGSCGACAFFDQHRDAAAAHDGLCRFNPPASQPGPDAHGLWPVVTDADWCAHFAPEPAGASVAAE